MSNKNLLFYFEKMLFRIKIILMKCELCPRKCGVNRNEVAGFCGVKKLKVALSMLHMWEEPIISCGNGSGAIFFSGCSLKCIYCQNHKISQGLEGKEITIQELAQIFKELEESGAANINLVTPTHFANEIALALEIYRPKIPIVWNTSGYEEISTIQKISKYVDIYLTDLKYFSSEISKEFSNAENYFEKASKAVLEMRKNQPVDLVENGAMKKGVIVRHLVLPTCAKDSIKVLDWINENLGNQTYISVMSQFTPCFKAEQNEKLKNKLKPIEYKAVLNHALTLGFENGFFQEFESANSKYIPKF